MALRTPSQSRSVLKAKQQKRQRAEFPAKAATDIDPNINAVPFEVTAFAAANFPPPAISDAIEDEPVFDKSKAKRVVKTKKSIAV